MGRLITNIGRLHGIIEKDEVLKKGADLARLASLRNAWLLTEGDVIHSFGEMSKTPGGNHETEDAAGAVVIPSFCDSHSHLVFAAPRNSEFEDKISGLTYQEIAARGGGILNSANALRKMGEDELFEISKERLKAVIRQGTGAIEIKSGYGLSAESELKMLRVIRRLKELNWIPIKASFLGAHALPQEFSGRKEDYVKMLISELLPEIAKEGLADFIDVFCEKNYFSVDDTIALLREGRKYGLQGKVHVNQFNALGGVKACIENGALSVDHLEVLEDADLAALKGGQTIACLLPGCSFFLGIPYAPARKMVDAGLGIALASDFNPGSCPSGDMSFVWALACIKMKLTPAEAFNAMTVNGAAAMGLSGKVGGIGRGMLANLLLLKKSDALSYYPYSFGENTIQKVMVKGNWF